MTNLLGQLKGTVIVSCQARKGEPFDAPHFMVEFAKSAEMAGSKALRINAEDNIRAVKEAVRLPIIGIRKRWVDQEPVFITPNLTDVREVIEAGAEIVGLDGTVRPRPGGESLQSLIDYCHSRGVLVLADIATAEDASYAAELGADMVATTLSGYTVETNGKKLPDFELLQALSKTVSVPVLMEGGIIDPQQVTTAFELGAYAVIIGKAITMPHFIARRYIEKSQNLQF